MVAAGLWRWAGGEVEMAHALRASRSPRYDWVVELGDLAELAAAVRGQLRDTTTNGESNE